MINITRPDAEWLLKGQDIIDKIRNDYPELFSREDLTTLLITGQLIRSLNK